MSTFSNTISFGIEFEFIVPQAQGPDSHAHDDRFYHTEEHDAQNDVMEPIIVNCLKNTVPITTLDDDHRTYLHLARERGINLAASLPLPYSYFWRYSYEGSLQPRRNEDVEGNYSYWPHPVEVSSRILGEFEFDEVTRVYTTLRSSLRINLNSTCSFHVHVGTGHLDLVGHKKLATLVMVCEDFLWRCCEGFRRDGLWCLSISKYSKTARLPSSGNSNDTMYSLVPPGIVPDKLYESLRGIWTANSIGALQGQLLVPFGVDDDDDDDYYHRGAFAIRQHVGSDVNCDPCPTTTAEFRYSHASGDPQRDHCFVRICIALVRAAQHDGPAYRAILTSFAKGGDFGNFLNPLNLQLLYTYCTAAEREYIRRAAEPMKPATEFLPRI